MALIIKLACRVSHIHGQYADIHHQVFDLFSRKKLTHWTANPDYPLLERDIKALETELEAVSEAITALDEAELPRRSRTETRDSLLSYCDALGEALQKLAVISAGLRQEQAGVTAYDGYKKTGFKPDCIAYDDTVQHLRALGKKLNRLFSAY